MRPDSHNAMRRTIEHGPAYCPPGLFAGSIQSIVLGLKAHANTISHARHVAIEETYPRTRTLIGEEAFHAEAAAHLADPANVRRQHAMIGEHFADRLRGTARDMARVEWAWLEAHGAADADPFDLAAIAGLDPVAVAGTKVALHPATRFIAVHHPLHFDGLAIANPAILITRPGHEVFITGAEQTVVEMVVAITPARALGNLLELDAAAATTLVRAGALIAITGTSS